MKKARLSALAAILLSTAFSGAAFADHDSAKFLRDSSGKVVHSGFGECWRLTSTPADAVCDDTITIAPVAAAESPAPQAVAEAAQAEAPKQIAYAMTIKADVLFAFDKSVLRPEGIKALDEAVAKIPAMNIAKIDVVGNTDSVGSDRYNEKLGQRRADAVKAYLVKKGIDASTISTVSHGEKDPVTDNKTAAHRAENRRVDINVTGTSK